MKTEIVFKKINSHGRYVYRGNILSFILFLVYVVIE
jgi:hypothetical protein